MRRLAFSFLAVALIASVPALAQEQPPARVGRVSFVSGQLGFHTAGETAWSAAAVNYPVATGGVFWADPKTRAELRVGSRTIDLDRKSTRLNSSHTVISYAVFCLKKKKKTKRNKPQDNENR